MMDFFSASAMKICILTPSSNNSLSLVGFFNMYNVNDEKFIHMISIMLGIELLIGAAQVSCGSIVS